MCRFDPFQKPYTWGMGMTSTHYQRRCQRCGLWTVWEHKKTGEILRQCK